MKRLLRLLVLLVAFVFALAVTLRLRYGGGAAFPAREVGPPRLPESALEVVAELPTPPGNVAVAAAGRVFATLHPEARPEWKVVEIRDGRATPWPSLTFQTGEGEPRFFRDVLSLRIDRKGRLWTLDNGMHGLHPGRLLAFDVATGAVVHEFEFPREVAGLGSHLNDFQVSPDGRHLYIAEASFFAKTPALVVYDVETRRARRLLEGHPSVTAERYTPVVQGRKMEILGLVAVRPGVDSIALDGEGEWLYFAPVTNRHLYRVRAVDLRDGSLAPDALASRVETFAPKPMSDGLTMDAEGNVYVSALEESAIVVLRHDRALETLVRSPRLRWPDGFGFGPGGWLYVTCSSLHAILGRPWAVAANAPYQIFRLRPGAEGVPGH
jgi:sugar lactone lactonase YvrE